MEEQFYFSIASGSTGNCGLYVCGQNRILMDLGVSVRRLRQALAKFSMDIPDLNAILLTHEHIDHAKGLATYCKKYTVPLYATYGTAQALIQKVPQCENLIHIIQDEQDFVAGNLQVTPFLTPHDAAESCGYRLRGKDTTFGYCTDLGFVPQAVQNQLVGCDTVVLESNHDPNMLMVGPYPYPLKQRVKGQYGHLSNPDCAALAAMLAEEGTSTLILAHLSEHNNTPLLAFQETKNALQEIGSHCELFVAPKNEMEEPILLGKTVEVRTCCP